MRLIDADALKERYENTTDCALVCIEEALTIDAKSVIHACWIEKHYARCCSNCGKEHRGAVVNFPADYCSYCGAKMDEKSEVIENETNP